MIKKAKRHRINIETKFFKISLSIDFFWIINLSPLYNSADVTARPPKYNNCKCPANKLKNIISLESSFNNAGLG